MKKIRFNSAISKKLTGLFVCITMLVFMTFLPAHADESSSKKIAATVNGTPVYQKDIDDCMPKDAFGPMLVSMRRSKLNSLIYTAILNQFIEKEKIKVDEEEVDKRMEELKKFPPSAECSCCRYESLEQFMTFNLYTLEGLREDIRANMGMEAYIDTLWLAEYPTEKKRAEFAKTKRADLESLYINVSHIFFNVFQDPDFKTKPEKVIQKKMALASSAVERLKKGENFEDLAEKISEDMISKINGGRLGCIKKDLFGPEFSKAAAELSFGHYSPPVQSVWGVHIIKRNNMTDKDIIELVKNQFMDDQKEKLITKLMENAKIVLQD